MANLPKSDVVVDVNKSPDGKNHGVTVGISRDRKQRAWTGSGSTPSEAVKDVIEKIINDPLTGEFM